MGPPPILIVLLTILAVGYLVHSGKISQNQKTLTQVNKKANWKTYPAMDNTYTFKYPPGWYIGNPTATSGLSFFEAGVTPIHSTSGNYGNETLVTTDYAWQKFDVIKNVKYSDGSLANVETTVGGKPALKTKSGKNAYILLKHLQDGNDRILNLRLTEQIDPSILDQILATFKFQ